MKNITRILCLLLAGVMLIGLVATAVFAAEDVAILDKENTAVGIPNDAGNITWLSDLYSEDIADASQHMLVETPKYVMYSYVQPKGGTPTPRLFTVDKNFFGRAGVYSNNGADYEWNASNSRIVLGANGTVCKKGLGLQPTAAGSKTNSEVVFDISSFDVDYFYSLVGIVGKGNNSTFHAAEMAQLAVAQQKLTFILYGSKESKYSADMNFTELAKCENVCESAIGEFKVNIAGYKFLRLVCDNVNDENGASFNNEAAWGNLCIYKAGAGNGVEDTGTSPEQNATPTDNYKSSTTGIYTGVPRKLLSGATYVSKLTFISSSNTPSEDFPEGKPTGINYPYNMLDGVITLGVMDKTFSKGLGMHPKNPNEPLNGTIESWTTVDISNLNVDRFYSVVGITNDAGKDGASEGVIFRVYGDAEGKGEFKLLAQSELITTKKTGEFLVDITGIKVLKLAVAAGGSTHSASACAFADAMVYSSTYEPNTETQPETTVPAENDENTEDSTPPSTDLTALIIGAVAAVMIVTAIVVVVIIKKKKKA